MAKTSKAVFEFAGFTLDISTGALRHGSEQVRLSPKGFATLVWLATHPGNLVSRDDLKAAVWEGRYVSDNSIDQKIAEVRKRLAEAGAPADLIQNRHGRGWCFTATVTELTETDLPAAPPPLPSRYRKHLWPTVAAAVVLSTLAFLGASALARLPAEPRILGYRQLTDDGRPKYGPLITDGSLVYFLEAPYLGSPVTSFSVRVAGGLPAPVVLPFPRAIPIGFRSSAASLVLTDNAPSQPSLFLWDRSSGPPRPTGLPGHISSEISPDAGAVASGEPGFLMVQSRGAPAVRVPIAGSAGLPRWSPDGRRIRFTVSDPKSVYHTIWEVDRNGSHLHRLPLDSAAGAHGVSGGTWTRDGRYFVFLDVDGTDRQKDIWTVRDDGPSLRPVRLTDIPMNFGDVTIAPGESGLLAIATKIRGETARFDTRSRQWLPFWDGIAAMDISFFRNGRRAAFCRFPEHTLWVSDADGLHRRQLTQPPLEAYQPHWSPDGRRLAFMARLPGKPWRMYLISPSGGEPELANPADSMDQGVPSWSPEGRYLVYGELRTGKPPASMVIRLLDLHDRTVTVLPGSAGKWSPRWSPDGRYILAASVEKGDLWLFSMSTRRWSILVSTKAIDDADWSIESRYIYFNSESELFRVRISDRRQEDLGHFPDVVVTWSGVAPDGSPLVLRSVRNQEIYSLDWKLP